MITLTSLDLKLLADSWNLIVKLIGDYNGIITSEEPSNLIEKRILNTFCNEIVNTLTQKDNSKRIQMKLKLAIFYLHSIYILCHSRSVVEKEWKKLFDLYKTFLLSKYKILASHEDIKSKMSDYFSKIYQKIYKNELLLQILIESDDLEIVLETVEYLTEDSSGFTNRILKEFGLFDSLLKCISDSNLVLDQNHIFQRTIEVLTVLRVSQTVNSLFSRRFDQKIATGVLQTDSASLAVVCIHVILQRLR